jgi:hypothetical protein
VGPIAPGPDTDPRAAETLPRNDLGRAEASDLVTAVFGDVLDEAAGIYDELEVERFHSDYVAVVAPNLSVSSGEGEAQPGLLTSVLPLRAENSDGVKSAVDLDLEYTDGVLQPDNPLVDLEIPRDLGDGISLPGAGVTIALRGAPPERAPSTVAEEMAFYPNVASDSDFVVLPTATGVETSTILRTPDAPSTQTFDLTVPAGAHLEAGKNGGATVMKSGTPLLVIPAPTAFDAAGDPVPVALDISDDSINVHASPSTNAVYPILVDPIFESYYWDQYAPGASPEWVLESAGPFGAAWNPYTGGIVLASVDGSTVTGTQSSASYYVPRYFSDFNDPEVNERPKSYIRNMTMTHSYFAVHNFPGFHYPVVQLGLWSPNKSYWLAYGRMYSDEAAYLYPGFVFNFINPNENEDAKQGFVSLSTTDVGSVSRTFGVGQATVEISDTDSPGFGYIEGTLAWVNGQASSPVSYIATDTGLGVHRLQVQQTLANGTAKSTTVSVGCLGSARSPCPRAVENSQKPIPYDPSSMPQGENFLKLTAFDPINHPSTVKEPRVKVDHSKPSLALSGTATEQASLGTKLPKYTLKYSAADGGDAVAAALSSFGGAGTAPGKTEGPTGAAVEANGNVLVVDKTNKRVMRYDKNGVFLNQFGTVGTGDGQFNDPTAIAVSAAGNIWITEAANARVQEFNASGQFIRKITCACFSQPYAIAAGPNQAIWIADIGTDKLFKYNESGVQLLVAHGNQANPAGAATEMTNVTGIATDANGNVWAAEYIMNKLLRFDVSGNYVSGFGTLGSGDGQVKNPSHVAVAPSGHLMVVDYNNSRLQEFKTDGTFMRKFGSLGSGSGQMNAPQQPAFGSGGVLYVPDYLNHRVNRWAHADEDPQSGVASTEVQLDGVAVAPKYAPGCVSKNCSINKEWTLEADKFSVGPHTLKVIATDGVGLQESKSIPVETHGDLKAPMIALSGSMTEQASLGTTRPAYTLKVNATDPGSSEERKSGVASVTIKVDGVVKDSSSPGCPAGSCSILREWTLDSSKYPAGSHSAIVTATDAAGKLETKTLSFKIGKDETAPTITASNAFYNAPEGWVEQKSYANNATGLDAGGYGITSISLKIDGQVVKNQTQTCPAGGCSLMLGVGSTLDMSVYDGGAHPAELVAVDGAGNTAKKAWTINVDPKGVITSAESEETLEAVEETASVNLVGPSVEEDYEGTAPNLEFAPVVGRLESVGTAAPIMVDLDADGGLEVEIPTEASLVPGCDEAEGAPPGGQLSPAEEEELSLDPEGTCVPVTDEGAGPPGLEGVEITPVITSESVSDVSLTDEESAALVSNQLAHVDLVTRPLFDGGMSFTAIRDKSASDEFSWRVRMESDQTLTQVDAQHALVSYEGGHPAMSIAAIPAHDAVGTTVPTSISVAGDVLTLHVEHQTGGPYVYPVVGGAGWQGGFQTYQIAMPQPPGQSEGEEGGGSFGTNGTKVPTLKFFTSGPPTVQSLSAPQDELQPGPAKSPRMEKNFKFTYCVPHNLPTDPVFDGHLADSWWNLKAGSSGVGEGQNLPRIVSECHREDFEGVYWGVSVAGKFHYIFHQWVWQFPAQWDCRKWGAEQPARINCKAMYSEPRQGGVNAVRGPISVIGQFRFPANSGQWVAEARSACFTEGGLLYPNPRRAFDNPLERPMIWDNRYVIPGVESCNWE